MLAMQVTLNFEVVTIDPETGGKTEEKWPSTRDLMGETRLVAAGKRLGGNRYEKRS